LIIFIYLFFKKRDLSDKGLSGPIPIQLIYLSNLQTLYYFIWF